MEAERSQRRLATILAADVCGYSRIVEADEEGALAALADVRRRWDETIGAHNGRVFHRAGDGILAEFQSPVEALRAALEMQGADRGLKFRVGLNLGDVVVDPSGDLLGHGVNVAARLESLAAPGEILMSEAVYEQVRGRTETRVRALGRERLKHMGEKIAVYCTATAATARTLWAARLRRATRRHAGAIALVLLSLAVVALATWRLQAPNQQEAAPASTITLAVLPFQNLSGDPAQIYFADGLTTEITTALARISALSVTSRRTAFQYRGVDDPHEVGRMLGVKYLLQGGVQRAEGRVRINVQLIDADSGRHLWARNYDRRADDIFAAQDDIVTAVATELRPQLYNAARRAIAGRATRDASAWELFMQATFVPGDAQDTLAWEQQRIALARRAIALDPNFGPAHSVLADKLAWLANVDPPSDTPALRAEAATHARRALDLSPADADTVFNVSLYHWHFGELDHALELQRRTLELDPNHVLARALTIATPYSCAPAPQSAVSEERALAESLAADSPLRGVALERLAWLYMNNGDLRRANETMRRSVQVFNTPISALTLAMLREHAGDPRGARAVLADERANWPNLDPRHFAEISLPRRCGGGEKTAYLQELFRQLANEAR